MKKWLVASGMILTLVVAGCGDDKAEEQEEKTIVKSTSVEEVQTRFEEVKAAIPNTSWYEGTYEYDIDMQMAALDEEQVGKLAFQSTTVGDLFFNVEGTHTVNGTEQKVHRFKTNTQDKYIYNAEADTYEHFGASHLGYPYGAIDQGPMSMLNYFVSSINYYYDATHWEDDGDTTTFITDLTKDSSLTNAARNYLLQHYDKDTYAEILRYVKDTRVDEGTFKMTVANEGFIPITVEWDFVLTGKNFEDEALNLDYYALHTISSTDEEKPIVIDDVETIMTNAKK